MSGTSSVGPISTEGAGDQRNKSEAEKQEELPPKFEEGKENSHQANDSKDERSIGNRLAAAEEQNGNSNDTSGKIKSAETKAGEIDPTLPAKMHGNEPSRGAKIDKSIADDEEEIIRKMDEAKAQKKANK